jgi:hypothetical protein
MRVMVFGKATKETESGGMPSKELWEAMERFNEELMNSGIVLSGEGLMPSSAGARIKYSGKEYIVTDGPFAETKEVIAGYSIWEVKSMEEAISWVKRSPMGEGAEVEIRPIFSYSAEDVKEIVSQDQ